MVTLPTSEVHYEDNEKKAHEGVPNEAQLLPNHGRGPVSLSWGRPTDVMPKRPGLKRLRKLASTKVVSSGLEELKPNRVVADYGLLNIAILRTIDRIGGM